MPLVNCNFTSKLQVKCTIRCCSGCLTVLDNKSLNTNQHSRVQTNLFPFFIYFHLLFLAVPWALSAWAANSSSNKSSKLPRESEEGILFHLTSGRPSERNTVHVTMDGSVTVLAINFFFFWSRTVELPFVVYKILCMTQNG